MHCFVDQISHTSTNLTIYTWSKLFLKNKERSLLQLLLYSKHSRDMYEIVWSFPVSSTSNCTTSEKEWSGERLWIINSLRHTNVVQSGIGGWQLTYFMHVICSGDLGHCFAVAASASAFFHPTAMPSVLGLSYSNNTCMGMVGSENGIVHYSHTGFW